MSERSAATAVGNHLEISVFGMKRSGNHAVVGWLLRELGPCGVHLNDVTGVDPFRSCSEIEAEGIAPVICRPTLWNRISGRRVRPGTLLYSMRDPRLDVEALRAHAPKNALILSYEDRLPDDAIVASYEREHDAVVGPSSNRRRVLLLRDAHNLLASRLRAPFPRTPDLSEDVDLYKRFARDFLEAKAQPEAGTLAVSFNDWFRSAEYRRGIARALGFETDGAPFRSVHELGSGSSFDGRRWDGRADEMAVLERWKLVADDTHYRAALADPELLALTDRIFGEVRESGAAR